MLLKAEHLDKSFGGLKVTNDVSFSVEKGEIFGIIGPNGAGKTTLFNEISGFIHPDHGTITYKGSPISRLKPKDICALGITRTFQIAKPFPKMTVIENAMVGAFLKTRSRDQARDKALEVLKFVKLDEKKDMLSSNLTISDRKRLELAKALSTEPEILLLDEVMAGLTQTAVKRFLELIHEIRNRGTTILIIEHNMEAIMSVSDRILVLNYGQVLAEGKPEVIANHPQVIEAYIGGELNYV